MEDRERYQKDIFLDRVNEIIDFTNIEKLLQKIEVVEEIHDRRSFERFVGEEARNYQVDDIALVKFRKRMRDHAIYVSAIELIE